MPQYQSEPPYQPRLRPHRLVPADTPLPGDVSAEPMLESWALATGVALPPEIAEGGRALAQRAWLVIEKAALTLDAIPPILKAAEAPEETLETLKVIASVLLALPDQLAGGMDTSIERADRMFAQLLNAPGRPGLIEQVMFALACASESRTGEQELPDYTAELETLRRLHRDLVALQMEWDDLLAPLFPEEPASPAAVSSGNDDAASGATQPLPSIPAPLPEGLVVTVSPSEGARLSRFMRGQRLPRLALLITLLLFVSGTGMLMLRHSHTPAINAGNAVLAIGQQTPLATATSQPTQQTAPTATPTPRPTSIPRRPAPTTPPSSPTPTPVPGALCLPGATFCASALWLRVPCASQGSITFQLTNNTNQKQSWLAVSSAGLYGNPLVSISPSSGHLKSHQTITLTVWTSVSDDQSGIITISGAQGTLPVIIALVVCDG